VVLSSEETLRKVQAALAREGIGTRRYFYPSLNTLSFVPVKYACPVSEDLSRRVLALPLYVGILQEEVARISSVINGIIRTESVK